MALGHVLIIEDDPPTRMIEARLLQRLGYTVEDVATAAEGQARVLAADRGAFDAVLVDYRLPLMNGLEFIAWLERADPALGSLLLSAQNTSVLEGWSDHPGMYGHFSKPLDRPRLEAALREVVAWTRARRNATAGPG